MCVLPGDLLLKLHWLRVKQTSPAFCSKEELSGREESEKEREREMEEGRKDLM